MGGLNVYAYVRNHPTARIDPNGLFDVETGVVGGIGGAIGGARGGPWAAAGCAVVGFFVAGYEKGDAERFWDWLWTPHGPLTEEERRRAVIMLIDSSVPLPLMLYRH